MSHHSGPDRACADSRYYDHLPLYRQSQMLARHGVALARSTLAEWVKAAA